MICSFWNPKGDNYIKVYKYNNEKKEYKFIKNIEHFCKENNSAINMVIINNEKELVCSYYLDQKLIFFNLPSFSINLVIKNINVESFSSLMVYDKKKSLLYGCGWGVSVISTKNHKILGYFNLDIKGLSIFQRANGNILIGTEKHNKKSKKKKNVGKWRGWGKWGKWRK